MIQLFKTQISAKFWGTAGTKHGLARPAPLRLCLSDICVLLCLGSTLAGPLSTCNVRLVKSPLVVTAIYWDILLNIAIRRDTDATPSVVAERPLLL